MRVNIVRPIYRKYVQINQYKVTFLSEKGWRIVTVEVAARDYASAKKFVEEKYRPRQVYSVCLIETDIWRDEEGCTYIVWWERKKRWL